MKTKTFRFKISEEVTKWHDHEIKVDANNIEEALKIAKKFPLENRGQKTVIIYHKDNEVWNNNKNSNYERR